MVLRRLSLTSAIPFGPFLLAGCWLVLAFPDLVTAVIGARDVGYGQTRGRNDATIGQSKGSRALRPTWLR